MKRASLHLLAAGLAGVLAFQTTAANSAVGDPTGLQVNIASGGPNNHDPYFQDFDQRHGLIALTGGGLVVGWRARDEPSATPVSPDGQLYGSYFRILTGAGALVGAAPISPYLDINPTGQGYQNTPMLAPLSGGGFVTIWNSVNGPGDTYDDGGSGFGGDTYGRVYAANGTAVSATFKVNESDPNGVPDEQTPLAVVGLTGGGFAVAWNDNNDSPSLPVAEQNTDDLFLRVYNASGAPQAASVRLGGAGQNAFLKDFGTLVALANGSVAVSWRTRDSIGDGTGTSLDGGAYAGFFQIFNSSGVAVNSATAPYLDINPDGSGSQHQALLAVLTGGNLAVLWNSANNSNDGANSDVGAGSNSTNGGDTYTRVYQPNGTPVSGSVRVNDVRTDDVERPEAIVARSDGGYAIVWIEDDRNTAGALNNTDDFYARSFSAAGAALNPSILIGGSGADPLFEDFNRDYGLVALSDGGFVAALRVRDDSGGFGTGTGLDGPGDASAFQAFNANGSARGGFTFPYIDINANGSGNQNIPRLVAISTGGFAMTWNSTGNTDDGANSDVGTGSSATRGGDTWTRLYNNDATPASATRRGNSSEPTGINDEQTPSSIVRTSANTYAIVIKDENRNSGNTDDYFLRAFETAVAAAPPTVTVNTANLAVNATTLTIAGSNFNTTPASNTVALTPSGSATVTAATATALTLSVSGLSTGNLFAVVTTPAGNSGSPVQVATVTPVADLSITKTDGVATATPGGSVTYTITASNVGPSAVTGATVADTFPGSLTCTWTCVGAGGGTCTASGSGNISNNVNLPSGSSVTYTASCTISAAATGSLSNTATVSSATADPNSGNNSATDTDTLSPQANLDITKTDGVTTVNAGGSTTYTITASNAGPSNTTATVADTFPASLTCTWSCLGAGGGTCTAAGTGNINNGVTLPSGGSVTYTAPCSIAAGASGTLSNTATVTGVHTDPTLGNNSATDSDTINALPSLSINDVSLNEGDSGTTVFTFTALLSIPAGAGGVSFDIATANGTAVAPGDYTSKSLTGQTIPAGSSTYSFTVLVNGDTLNEANETFFVNVTNVTNAIATDGQSQGTIVNDDAVPSLSINSVVVTEGNTGTTNASFSVSLSPASGQTVTVNYASADGSATAGSDYTAASGTLSFTPGQTTQPITLQVTGDNVVEANEAFTIGLSGASNATIGTATGTGTITNDDSAGITLVESAGNTAVTEGGATDTYTLVLTSQPTGNVTVTPSVGTQLQTNLANYVFTTADWNVAQIVTVTAVDERTVEGAHAGTISHAVTSSDGNYSAFVVPSVNATISDNDSATYQFTAASSSTSEALGSVTISVSTTFTSSGSVGSNALETAISVPYTLGAGTANGGGTDYTLAAGTVSIPTAGTTQTITATVNNENLVEGPETISVNLGTETGGTPAQQAVVTLGAPSSHTATINDDDSAVVNFAPAAVSQTEAISPMAFTVTLSNPVQSGVTLSVNSALGTAGAADFTAISGTVSFGASSTTAQAVNVIINNDLLDENDETFGLTLSGLTATGNVTLGASSATGTIQDDDALPVLSISNPSQLEGNASSAPMNFVVTLTPVSGRAVSFTRASTDGTATVANNDYMALVAAGATIPAGSTSLSIPVTINGDSVFEGNETFSLTLSAISNATPGTLTGTGTILEDDAEPTTTTITSVLPPISVTGQVYTVSVRVSAQTLSPPGTITVSDGSASCVPATLVAGSAPNSTASCTLASSTAGLKTLTASYTPSNSGFIASSGTTSQQVNAAATAISVSGPLRSRINQSSAFSFALGATPPGAGAPTGTVSLNSGASSCTVTLPTSSCNLSFSALGSRTVTASYAGDSNFSASSSSGASNAQTLVFALTDLSVSKTDLVSFYQPGDLLVYTVQVRNLGPDTAANFVVRDDIPAGLINVVWSCDASGGAICAQTGGSGSLNQTIASLVNGALLNYTFYGNVSGSPLQLVNTAQVELPADTTLDDPQPANNSASDTNRLDFAFKDGFEDLPVNAQTGSYRLPSNALRGALDEIARVVYVLNDIHSQALRVYARVLDGQMQYALASRDASGALRLGEWRSYSGEPNLSWTARAIAGGWLLEGADLR